MTDARTGDAPLARGATERVLDALLGVSCFSWAVLGLLHEDGPPLLPRIGAAVVNATVGVLFLVRRPALVEARWGEVLRALPSILVGGAAWRISGSDWPLPLAAVFLGLALSTAAALAWLGTSFAIFAAQRTVRSSGPYRLVRHPIYLLELLLGAVAAGAHAWWAAPLAAVALGVTLVPRIEDEERVLRADPAYAEYARRVRYRLVPGLY